MIAAETIFSALKRNDVGLFAGVPDSLLKSLCAYLGDHCGPHEHIITANEGNAVALATGFYLATGKIGAVYMQNSGLGNCVNPLTSLADPDVYSIPMLLIVGWRGEPGIKDEPQHIKQGRITPGQLELLEIPHRILDSDSDLDALFSELFSAMREKSCPVALLVRKKTLSPYERTKTSARLSNMTREEALSSILELADPSDVIVSTTGKTSRELFELRAARGERQRDFLTVGSMGHTSSIALGVALGCPNLRVLCLDGDGSLIMHMGAMPIIGSIKPSNFVHVLLNNSTHESVGGQETVAGKFDFQAMAVAAGYQAYYQAQSKEELESCWEKFKAQPGPIFLELRICPGSRADLGRPTSTPIQNKEAFMGFCRRV